MPGSNLAYISFGGRNGMVPQDACVTSPLWGQPCVTQRHPVLPLLFTGHADQPPPPSPLPLRRSFTCVQASCGVTRAGLGAPVWVWTYQQPKATSDAHACLCATHGYHLVQVTAEPSLEVPLPSFPLGPQQDPLCLSVTSLPPSIMDDRITQNHRMAGVGRDLCGSSNPTPC